MGKSIIGRNAEDTSEDSHIAATVEIKRGPWHVRGRLQAEKAPAFLIALVLVILSLTVGYLIR